MSIPVWPSGLPPPIGQLGSLGTDALYEPPQETTFDDGPTRTRRRRLYQETPRRIVLRLTRAQFVMLKGFLVETLNNGTRRFQAPVRQPDGRLGPRICRIQGGLSEQDAGPTSVVSFTLMIKDW